MKKDKTTRHKLKVKKVEDLTHARQLILEYTVRFIQDQKKLKQIYSVSVDQLVSGDKRVTVATEQGEILAQFVVVGDYLLHNDQTSDYDLFEELEQKLVENLL